MKLLAKIFLSPFVAIYAFVIACINFLYAQKLLRPVYFDSPIICVGNLSTGGSGKTPHVDYLIQFLKNQYPLGVLSRGYRRSTSGFREVLTNSTAKEVGDEALLCKWKHPDIEVVVAENRALAIPQLLSEKESNFVVLMDDGFQHRSVRAGLNIILSPYHLLYTRDELLPWGNLREFSSGAKRADIIVVSHCPLNLSLEEKAKIKQELQLETYQHVFFSSLQYLPYYQVFQGIPSPVQLPSKSKILLLSGIANNSKIEEKLKEDFEEVFSRSFSDHHYFSTQDIESIIQTYNNIPGDTKYLVTTEKDLPRLQEYAASFNEAKIPVICLPIKINFGEEKERFENIIKFYIEKSLEDYQQA
ncbi:MAG: tetraacyldisaccharide 4'-kinase [Chitinophagales bacterium]|nr:tetraacyldisaccharide 4'-kinase [Chitinophagales bacterium]